MAIKKTLIFNSHSNNCQAYLTNADLSITFFYSFVTVCSIRLGSE